MAELSDNIVYVSRVTKNDSKKKVRLKITKKIWSKYLEELSSSSMSSEMSYMFLIISSDPIFRKSPIDDNIPQAI